MTLAATPLHTVADLLDPPDGKLYELIDGELAEKPMSYMSAYIGGRVVRHLGNYAEDRQLGWVVPEATIDCFDWRERYARRPDVTFTARSRLPTIPMEGVLTIAPDLCVEVVSPNDDAVDLELKTRDYFRAGVKLVWHIFPEARTIHVYHPDGTAAVLTDGGTLTGGDVLPGFSVAATDVLPPRAG